MAPGMLAGPHTQIMTEQNVPINTFFCFFLGGPLAGLTGFCFCQLRTASSMIPRGSLTTSPAQPMTPWSEGRALAESAMLLAAGNARYATGTPLKGISDA